MRLRTTRRNPGQFVSYQPCILLPSSLTLHFVVVTHMATMDHEKIGHGGLEDVGNDDVDVAGVCLILRSLCAAGSLIHILDRWQRTAPLNMKG